MYLKILALLVPREMKLESSGGVKAMTDEQIEQAIEAIQTMLEQQAKVIEGQAEPVALPAPDVVLDGPNKVMDAADTAIGQRELKPRKREAQIKWLQSRIGAANDPWIQAQIAKLKNQ